MIVFSLDRLKGYVYRSTLPQSQIYIFDIRNYFFMIARILTRGQDGLPDQLPAEERGERTSGMSYRVKIYDDINSSIAFYCTGSNDFLVALKKLLETDQIF